MYTSMASRISSNIMYSSAVCERDESPGPIFTEEWHEGLIGEGGRTEWFISGKECSADKRVLHGNCR